MTRIAVVSAGLSQPSSTRLLADRLAAATERALADGGREVTLDVIELRDHAHDLANNLVTGFAPPRLRETIERVTAAEGIIAVTPIFNASYSGLFKTFFDVLEADSLIGTPVLIGATGGTARHSLALEHAVRPMFTYLRAVVVPTSVYAASEDWASGQSDGLNARIARAAGEFADTLGVGRPSRPVDPYADPVPFTQLLGDTAR
ncbi:NADPH-dependent FMN reductase [Nocardia panacis]|uniref:NADPH-dependent FMN reductase n=1 Tax=Nocardia panacis TaxID=2340916 RepID=A0A3A4KPA2_9NOCA|nr:FMN reductase [Nocardia panacis]RJO79282.1 NADPH-dependent FMN reductase [Nocardia panacis]